jgi:hypothetical protein
MSFTISSTSSGYAYSDMPTGSVIQSALGRNNTSSTRVFTQRSVWEEVPGTLRCVLQPKESGNTVVVRSHLFWGGWSGSTDVSALFRIFYTTNGSTWNPFGNYNSTINGATSSAQGTATGRYNYAHGDNNASSWSDNILIHDTVSSTSVHTFAVFWACGYEANVRTLYWNRTINTGNSYNPSHFCSIQATEIKT